MNDKSDPEISFTPLQQTHFSLIYDWFNMPHVQSFYSLRAWTLKEVGQKLTPYIQGVGDMKCYVISCHKTLIGYIQRYPVKMHPWNNQDLTNEIIDNSAGIDLFIGEREFVGNGLGHPILDAFLKKHIWPHYRYCLADPDINNNASMSFFRKCGFKELQQISSKDSLQRSVTLQLFIKQREDHNFDS